MNSSANISEVVLRHYPETQAIYLFGSFGTEQEWPDSDVDIAVLLPPDRAKRLQALMLSSLHSDLEALLGRRVDLLNLRRVSTVMQKEIIMAERRIYTGDAYAAGEFEMLTISFYLKLNQERAGVLAEGLRSGSFHQL